jgi:hypothetical protein
MGVPVWFAERAYSTPSDDMWWPTPDDLRQAGVITGIAGDPAALAFHGLNATATQEDIDKALQKTSLYAAIKRAEPDTYHRISVAIGDAIRSGRSNAELAAVVRPFMYGILQKYQAHASDEAVIAFGERFVTEID